MLCHVSAKWGRLVRRFWPVFGTLEYAAGTMDAGWPPNAGEHTTTAQSMRRPIPPSTQKSGDTVTFVNKDRMPRPVLPRRPRPTWVKGGARPVLRNQTQSGPPNSSINRPLAADLRVLLSATPSTAASRGIRLNLGLHKELYLFEWTRKEQLESSANLPVALLTVLAGGVLFLVQTFPYAGNLSTTVFSVLATGSGVFQIALC